MKESLRLLRQIIDMERVRDDEFKRAAIAAHKASLSTGESKILFHLKSLEELIIREANQISTNEPEKSCGCGSEGCGS